MNLAALKIELIQKIIACNDLSLLTKIESILANVNPLEVNEHASIYEKTEKVLVFNEWQQKRIDLALQQFENGEYITEEEDKIDMEKWFEEQEKLYGQ